MNDQVSKSSKTKRRPLWRRRRFWLSVLTILVSITTLVIASDMMFSTPFYQGPESDHFTGGQFVNRRPIREHSFGDMLKHIFGRSESEWHSWTENNAYAAAPERVSQGDLSVTFISHSTVLIQIDGLNFLTDPMWSDRAGPVSFAGPKRHRAPGLALEDLPPIDYVLLSHNHYDHLDVATLRRLAAGHAMPIVTGLGNGAFLDKKGIAGTQEYDWGDSLRLSDEVTLYVLPARHFSGRGLTDHHKSLWVSFLLKGPAGAVYFAGDSGFDGHFEEIGRRFGPIRLALLPIGSYLPRWFMGDVHLSPEEAVRAHVDLRAATSMAIHFGTFKLGSDGQYQAVEELQKALVQLEGDALDFRVLDFGEGWQVPAETEAKYLREPD